MNKLTIKIGGLDSHETVTISKNDFNEIQWERILQWYSGVPLYITKNCFNKKQPSTINIPFVKNDGLFQTLRITPTGLVKHVGEEIYVFEDRFDPTVPVPNTIPEKIMRLNRRLGVTGYLNDDYSDEYIESHVYCAPDEVVMSYFIRYDLKNDEDVFLNAVNVYMIHIMALTTKFYEGEEDINDFHKMAMEKLVLIYRMCDINLSSHQKFMDSMREHRYYEPTKRILKGNFDTDISIIFPNDTNTMNSRKW